MLNLIGDIGILCFALSALPQVYTCFKQGNAEGISSSFLGLWVVGEICMVIYSIGLPLPMLLILNYIGNFIALAIIVYFKIKGRKNGHS